MATLTVGQGQQFSTISAAVNASHDGDVIQVQAGTYTNDFATINTNVTLEGVGGMVHMVATGNIPNDKGILVTNSNVTIDHFEFSGATGASGNDAGIRYQAGNLTLTNDYFHDNQDGLLAAANPTGTITIKDSEFAHNGTGDGYTHNLYVGDIAKLSISDSYFHDAVVGHEIKSRAEETDITNSRIFDKSSNSSYSVDLPNGGKAVLTGNTIEQGPNGGNPNIIAYGEEGSLHSGGALTVSDNTVLNDMGSGTMVWNAAGASVTVDGNHVFGLGAGQLVSGGGSASNTTMLSSEPTLDTSAPWTASTSSTGGGAAGGGSTGGTNSTGAETLTGHDAGDTLTGGSGDDLITGGAHGANFLRGGAGADSIVGGGGFDDINGNQGADTIDGGAGGGDWLVGGQGDDLITAHSGQNILYGNLGNDTLHGGSGGELMRGGQGDDQIAGGSGADWISGDRGSDTLTGGGGADTFHSFSGAGIDHVTDFNFAEGDRVQLDPGTHYTVSQVGADTVVDIGNGDQLVLANVQMNTLGSGWLLGG